MERKRKGKVNKGKGREIKEWRKKVYGQTEEERRRERENGRRGES